MLVDKCMKNVNRASYNCEWLPEGEDEFSCKCIDNLNEVFLSTGNFTDIFDLRKEDCRTTDSDAGQSNSLYCFLKKCEFDPDASNQKRYISCSTYHTDMELAMCSCTSSKTRSIHHGFLSSESTWNFEDDNFKNNFSKFNLSLYISGLERDELSTQNTETNTAVELTQIPDFTGAITEPYPTTEKISTSKIESILTTHKSQTTTKIDQIHPTEPVTYGSPGETKYQGSSELTTLFIYMTILIVLIVLLIHLIIAIFFLIRRSRKRGFANISGN